MADEMDLFSATKRLAKCVSAYSEALLEGDFSKDEVRSLIEDFNRKILEMLSHDPMTALMLMDFPEYQRVVSKKRDEFAKFK